MQDDFQRRIGKFFIPYECIQNNPQNVIALMKDMLVLKASYQFDMNAIEYTALSPDFSVVPDHLMAPRYKLETKPDGSLALIEKKGLLIT